MIIGMIKAHSILRRMRPQRADADLRWSRGAFGVSAPIAMKLAVTAVLPGVPAGRTGTDDVAVVGGVAAFGPATQHGGWSERRPW
jgi:hypothetical protein